MTSPGHKIGQILKLIYFRQHLSYSVDQKLKMSEMLIAILLVYSAPGITSGKKSLSGSKWRPFWKFWNIKHSFNLTSDMKISCQIMPKKFFYGDDVIDDVTGWPQNISLYSCLGEVGSGSKLLGQCLVNKCQYHNCLSRLYMPKDDLNELHFSRLQVKVSITGLLGDLGTNKQHCKLSQIQLFFRLWRHRWYHVATWKILRFLLKTHCRLRGWCYHPHSSVNMYYVEGHQKNP